MTVPATEPRARLENAIARAMANFHQRPATDEQLGLWAGLIERFADHVADVSPEHVLWAYSDRGIMAAHGVRSAGEVAVIAVVAGESIVCEMQFGRRVAGAAGAVHGGDIAAAFDFAMGALFTSVQPAVVPKRLEVRFHAPAPPGEMAHIEARVANADGRHFRVNAEMQAGGRLVASAEAEFVQLRPASV